jgi:hypothetical protein
VSGELSEPCPRLPFETTVCLTCGEGIRPARGYTWVDGQTFLPPDVHGAPEHNHVCPLSPMTVGEALADGVIEPVGNELPGDMRIPAVVNDAYVSRLGRCGLIWIGEQHYKTPREFMVEAARMGVSRRITAVPREFVIGETWVLLGHRKAIEKACPDCGDGVADPECPVCEGEGFIFIPGVITAFKPSAVEYVVKGDETDEEVEALEKRGLTPVKVINEESQAALEV